MSTSRLSPAMALFPLRLFLGITFVYAGVQKLSDPGFLHPGAPTYIGTQLEGFANGTPGGFILRTFAIPHPGVAGIGVAITEILIGLLVTAGLFTRIAAAGGMALNFLLFLTASWNTTPYFLGPDLVFTFAWLPFVLAGATGQPALDNAAMHPSEAMVRRTRLRPESPEADPVTPMSTRRTLLAEFGGIALAIAGISALVKGGYSAPRVLSAGGGAASKGAAKRAAAGSGGGGTTHPAPGSSKDPARRRQTRPREPPSQRPGRHLQRPLRWLAGHPDPRLRRQTEGIQRRLYPRRLHRRL